MIWIDPLPWPPPYYVQHLLVAILISVVAFVIVGQIDLPSWAVRSDAIWSGPAFYTVREIWQHYRKSKGKGGFWATLREFFDWEGMWWPVLGVGPFAIAGRLIEVFLIG